MKLFGDDSDEAWKWFGEHDPYYGVLSGPEYHQENLTPERRISFFELGTIHVTRVMEIASTRLGRITTGRCLDFGCGVGRLVIPFAARFEHVTGVDISPAMIAEARRNCAQAVVSNVEFVDTLERVTGTFDLVHSYIVLQHIPVRRGLAIIDRLIAFAKPGGICFLHISLGRHAGAWRDIATGIRKNVKPVHWVLNLLNGKPAFMAYMQSNRYDLNSLLISLHRRNITSLWVETENHGGPYSVSLAFRAPP